MIFVYTLYALGAVNEFVLMRRLRRVEFDLLVSGLAALFWPLSVLCFVVLAVAVAAGKKSA